MLTQEFDRETLRYLSDILAQENMTRDELIRNLIRDRWLLHQQGGIGSKGQMIPSIEQTASAHPASASHPFELAHNLGLFNAEAALPLTKGTSMSLEASAHRPKNPKQALADFVKRRNQRVCSF